MSSYLENKLWNKCVSLKVYVQSKETVQRKEKKTKMNLQNPPPLLPLSANLPTMDFVPFFLIAQLLVVQ